MDLIPLNPNAGKVEERGLTANQLLDRVREKLRALDVGQFSSDDVYDAVRAFEELDQRIMNNGQLPTDWTRP